MTVKDPLFFRRSQTSRRYSTHTPFVMVVSVVRWVSSRREMMRDSFMPVRYVYVLITLLSTRVIENYFVQVAAGKRANKSVRGALRGLGLPDPILDFTVFPKFFP